jgi:hypothetical protein
MVAPSLVTLLAGLATSALGQPAAVSVRTIAELPAGSFLESLVVRPNGDILTTNLLSLNAVYTIRQPASPHPILEVLAEIPAVQVVFGITEIPPIDGDESYIVVAGNLTSIQPAIPSPNSWSAFKLRIPSCSEPKLEAIDNFEPQTALFNGLTPIPGSPSTVLITDSYNGAIGRLDVATGEWDGLAFQWPELAPVTNSTLGIGAGSVKFFGDHLYFSNADLASIFRVPVDLDGTPLNDARPELVTNISGLAPGMDDFIFDVGGNIYITTNTPANSIVRIDGHTGESTTVLGGRENSSIASCSSLAFGRTSQDEHVLYVSLGRDLADDNGKARVVAVTGIS